MPKLKRNRVELGGLPNHRLLVGGELVDEDARPRTLLGEGVLDPLAELLLSRLDLDHSDLHRFFLSLFSLRGSYPRFVFFLTV